MRYYNSEGQPKNKGAGKWKVATIVHVEEYGRTYPHAEKTVQIFPRQFFGKYATYHVL
jgi:hypothetical protein